jgi:hypothetical protein
MDNFVAQLKHNRNIDTETGNRTKNRRFREIMFYIASSDPEVCIIDGCSKEGDVKFEVSMESLGLTRELYGRYKKDICSEFMADFLGELLIRENLNEFAIVLTNIHPEVYPKVVDNADHYNFGMDVVRDKFIFVFHMSLLKRILLEDVRKKI